MRILIIDDEERIRRGLSRLISSQPRWTVSALCPDAGAALAYLAENTVDVIITDIRMPGMSGLDLIQRLRDGSGGEVPIIILSGYADFHYAQRAIELYDVRVRGLMTIPPADAQREENMRYFQEVRALYVDMNEKLFHNELEYLSMGMSGDYADAIREGATMVRVGTAIFGARHYL